MASTFTSRGIEKPANGDDPGTWDVPVNANWDLINKLLSGSLSVSLSSSNVTLSATEAENMIYVCTGTLSANVQVVFPSVSAFYVIFNNCTGDFSVTFKMATGTGVIVPGGAQGAVILCDGTNFYPAFNAGSAQIGSILDYSGSTAPAGWALCYGQAVSRTGSYSQLFAIYNAMSPALPYGTGDGTTTFNLPDLRGRVGAGDDNMGGVAAGRLTSTTMTPDGVTLGAVGGAQTVTLDTTMIPAHAHSGVTDATTPTNPEYQSPAPPNPASGTKGYLTGTITTPREAPATTSTTGSLSHTHAFSTGNTGGGGAHLNIAPAMILSKIVRYA